jgi:beta-lactamase regulating signal transducer with metallopeptidase domain/ketosteroid isomerase-like protein
MNTILSQAPLTLELLTLLSLSAALLICAGIISLLVHRASAATRHLIWSLAIVGCLALPLLHGLLPERVVSVIPDVTPSSPVEMMASDAETWTPVRESTLITSPTHVTPPAPGRNWSRVLIDALPWIWAAGALLLLAQLAMTALRLRRIAAGAVRVDQPDWIEDLERTAKASGLKPQSIRLYMTRNTHAPMVVGLMRPIVLLPRDADDWDPEQRRQVLQHETAHLQRRDGLTQIAASIVTALYWMNPLVWLAARRMLIERESACDDQVLVSGIDATGYAHHLLGMARNLQAPALGLNPEVAMARRSEMSGRLLAILDAHRNRRAPGQLTWTVALLATLIMTTGLAVLTPGGRATATPAYMTSTDSSSQDIGGMKNRSADDWSLAQIREVIEAGNRTIETGVEKSDVDLMLQPYSPDVGIMAMGGGEGHGLQDMRTLFNTMTDNYRRLSIEITELQRINQDMVYEIGLYKYDRGREPKSLSGRYLSVWRYESGRWLIYRDISNF